MRNFYKKTALAGIALLSASIVVFAGNEKRAGQAGANELLINPWTRSSGLGGFNTPIVRGIEAMNANVAGLAFTTNNELVFSNTNWLAGSGISINAFGFSRNIKDAGVIGVAVTAIDFGDIDIRTAEIPEGGLGTFSPQFLNVALGFGKSFSSSIHTGVAVRLIDETISDISSTGFSLDAGVQYVGGKNDAFKFGITLRNVGPTMKYGGEGLAFKTENALNGSKITAQRRADAFELPTLLNIGIARDFQLGEFNKVTGMANFTSNSFTNDQYTFGAQYGYKTFLMLRAAYTYENADNVSYNGGNATTLNNGFSTGATIEIPLNREKGSVFGIDYAFRATHDVGPFNGTHSVGARLAF